MGTPRPALGTRSAPPLGTVPRPPPPSGRPGVDSGVAFSRAALGGEHSFDLDEAALLGVAEDGANEQASAAPQPEPTPEPYGLTPPAAQA